MNSKRALLAVVISVGAACQLAGAQWVNYPTAGIPNTADGKPNLTAPTPRTSEGKPDFSGVWIAEDQKYFMDLASGLKAEDVQLLPWALALQKERVARNHGDDPLAKCLPHGVPRVNTNGLFPFKIVQTPALIVLLYEQMYLFRQVFMDGRKLESDPNPSWLGYSTGKWDIDTLVVETSGFNDKTWLDTAMGRPATDALHVTERFRRVDFGHLELNATIDDQKAYAKPWTTTTQKFHLLLDNDILEFICAENEKDAAHMPGK
jgi:hypothetical protein